MSPGDSRSLSSASEKSWSDTSSVRLPDNKVGSEASQLVTEPEQAQANAETDISDEQGIQLQMQLAAEFEQKLANCSSSPADQPSRIDLQEFQSDAVSETEPIQAVRPSDPGQLLSGDLHQAVPFPEPARESPFQSLKTEMIGKEDVSVKQETENLDDGRNTAVAPDSQASDPNKPILGESQDSELDVPAKDFLQLSELADVSLAQQISAPDDTRLPRETVLGSQEHYLLHSNSESEVPAAKPETKAASDRLSSPAQAHMAMPENCMQPCGEEHHADAVNLDEFGNPEGNLEILQNASMVEYHSQKQGPEFVPQKEESIVPELYLNTETATAASQESDSQGEDHSLHKSPHSAAEAESEELGVVSSSTKKSVALKKEAPFEDPDMHGISHSALTAEAEIERSVIMTSSRPESKQAGLGSVEIGDRKASPVIEAGLDYPSGDPSVKQPNASEPHDIEVMADVKNLSNAQTMVRIP